MATPTQRLTKRTQEVLGEEVLLAVRVQLGEAGRMAKYGAYAKIGAFFTILALPLYFVMRLLGTTWGRKDRAQRFGILAFTPDEGRVLLSTSPIFRSRPAEVMHRFPQATPLEPNVEMMEEYMVAELTLDNRVFTVNGLDFRQLLKAVRAETIPSVSISSKIDRLESHTARYATREPGDYVK